MAPSGTQDHPQNIPNTISRTTHKISKSQPPKVGLWNVVVSPLPPAKAPGDPNFKSQCPVCPRADLI